VAEADPYNCRGCSDRLPGPPAAITTRGPVCDECLLRLIPSREQLELEWVRAARLTVPSDRLGQDFRASDERADHDEGGQSDGEHPLFMAEAIEDAPEDVKHRIEHGA
jgi:hypothetical protein